MAIVVAGTGDPAPDPAPDPVPAGRVSTLERALRELVSRTPVVGRVWDRLAVEVGAKAFAHLPLDEGRPPSPDERAGRAHRPAVVTPHGPVSIGLLA